MLQGMKKQYINRKISGTIFTKSKISVLNIIYQYFFKIIINIFI